MKDVKRRSGTFIGHCEECWINMATFDVVNGEGICPACGHNNGPCDEDEARPRPRADVGAYKAIMRDIKCDKDDIERHKQGRFYVKERNIAEMYFRTGGKLSKGCPQLEKLAKRARKHHAPKEETEEALA